MILGRSDQLATEILKDTTLTDAQEYDIIDTADGCCRKRNSAAMKARLESQKGKYYIILDHTLYGKRQRKTIGTGLDATDRNRAIAERMMECKKAEWESKEMIAGHPIDFNLEDKTKAVRKEKKIFPKVEKPKDIAEMQFSEYMLFWLEKKRNTIAESTLATYESTIARVIAPYFSQYDVKIRDIDAYKLEQFYSDVKDERGIKNETIRRYHAIIKSALFDAYIKDIIPNNPADKVILPKKEKFYSEVYDERQVTDLINCAKDTEIYIPILIGLSTGMRRNEILGLRWKDIDFDNGIIHVRGTIHDRVYSEDAVDGLKWFPRAKTASSLRNILIDDHLIGILKFEKERQKERAETTPNYSTDWTDYVCLRTQKPNAGKLLRPNCFTQMYSKLLNDCGLPHIRFHDLRHTVAYLLNKHGAPMEKVQQLLGHSDIHTTVSVYGHMRKVSDRKLVSTMSAIMSGGTD